VPAVVLYTKRDCCLCDDAKAVLARVRTEVPFELEEVDIEGDPDLLARFGTQIPVVFIEGRKAFKYRIDEAMLVRKLRSAGGEAA
jgi:glutaredoxin